MEKENILALASRMYDAISKVEKLATKYGVTNYSAFELKSVERVNARICVYDSKTMDDIFKAEVYHKEDITDVWVEESIEEMESVLKTYCKEAAKQELVTLKARVKELEEMLAE